MDAGPKKQDHSLESKTNVSFAQTSELTGFYQQLRTGLYRMRPSDWTVYERTTIRTEEA